MAMCVAGLFVGFYKGWTLAFAMLGIAPIMLIGMGIFSSVMMKRASVTMRAYGQSAGYAEQALSAIRIVVSFGQEELEISNYSRFLKKVTEASLKGGMATGFSMGFFFLCIYLCYAYCFLIGSIWVDKPYWNDMEGRPYKAGDCLAVFFGILFGLFALGGAGPAISAVNDAKVAGKIAFEIIDRVPLID
jgi:ATP-binding cassette subfamily B (MDR/TAP) protein 1